MPEVKAFEVTVRPERCKECAICIEFCPKQVLVAGDSHIPVAKNILNCSGCRMCEYRCPDLAITVRMKGEVGHGF
jgi:2-oxoglutarate ferredoxin oxidoreductase subunit delta